MGRPAGSQSGKVANWRASQSRKVCQLVGRHHRATTKPPPRRCHAKWAQIGMNICAQAVDDPANWRASQAGKRQASGRANCLAVEPARQLAARPKLWRSGRASGRLTARPARQ